MTAHVSDFVLARFLLQASKNPFKTEAMSVALKGSIGYIPPEYGLGGHVSVLGDVYSFGILLLEMFTGKRPTDDMFKDDLSIHKFVAIALPENAMDVIDIAMLDEVENVDNETNEEADVEEKAIIKDNDAQANTSGIAECLVSAMRIGLSCSSTSPGERMAMNLVVNKLHDIRDSFLTSNNRNRKTMN